MTDPSLVEALRRSRLGLELSDEQAHMLAGHLAFRDLKPDEVLVREGASDNHLYVIVKGALGVVRRAATPDAVTLLTLTSGDLVGELSFIDETPHYASLVSIGPTRVFGLEREKLESLLLTRPEIVYRVMRAIVRTVHEIQRRISMQSVELTNYIYKQHGKY
ncbi:MAG TPA: cyclic nucleotide-binding domain-containing protein [Casimicrobiaceae bacterium]|nr:cyclic nucleotide-binding domain-containing protein [Casimicrobiaceae bacterium]